MFGEYEYLSLRPASLNLARHWSDHNGRMEAMIVCLTQVVVSSVYFEGSPSVTLPCVHNCSAKTHAFRPVMPNVPSKEWTGIHVESRSTDSQ